MIGIGISEPVILLNLTGDGANICCLEGVGDGEAGDGLSVTWSSRFGGLAMRRGMCFFYSIFFKTYSYTWPSS